MKAILLLLISVVVSTAGGGPMTQIAADGTSRSLPYAIDSPCDALDLPFLHNDIVMDAGATGHLRCTSAQHASHPPPPAPEAKKERLVVDVDKSVIHWKGTKFWGMGKHEGVVRLAKGDVFIREEAIVAGRFVLDMTTIEVTDIPESDPIPRRRLREHLKHEHFFYVDRYPTAAFEISSAGRGDDGHHRITGRLTMRGTTRAISFDADIPVMNAHALRATARFSINRHDWGVAYRGSRLTNDLVDDLIELKLVLVADKPDAS